MNPTKHILFLIILTLSGIGLVTALFVLSEEQIHRNNSFIRRYPQHPVTREKSFDLKFNSYYLAGVTKDSIYLGNFTAPLHLLSIDKHLTDTSHHKLTLERMGQFEFKSVRIQVREPYFYLSDGTVPVIYRGKIGKWQARLLMKNNAFFSTMVPVNESHFSIRARSSSTNQNELGLIRTGNPVEVTLNPELLEKQLDGIFDVDGFLLFSEAFQRVIYVYRYRNQFLVANEQLELIFRGKTIDTVSKVQLDIAEIASKNQRKIGSNSLHVNLQATTAGKYLFTQSGRLGKFEDEKLLKQASIIDVYDLDKKTYALSFYLYHFQRQNMREFFIHDKRLYSLNGRYLVSHQMKPKYFGFEDP